jgi:AraC-like DNA-binding protein/mannose-6-phosphate isomerase-like protein (cupin superfamily)
LPGVSLERAAMRTDVARQLRFWSTASVEPARAFKFWVDTLCSEMVELRVKTSHRDTFEAWMLQKALGPVNVNFIYTRDAQDVWRTRAAIGRSTHESRFYLIYVRNGTFTFDHYGRSFAVGADECVLIDSTEPYYFRSSEFAAGTSIQIPQKWLSSWIALPQERVGQVVTGATPWGRALLATLGALNPKSVEDLVLPGEVVSEQVASLLTLAVSPSSVPTEGNPRRTLLPDVQQSLREHAHDEMLSPAKVAQMHGISRRHLHALFAKAGTTFSRELMSMRLERALRHLGDPRFSRLTVSEIAWRCGFNDSSHFARRFHQRYGISPREQRRALLTHSVPEPPAD